MSLFSVVVAVSILDTMHTPGAAVFSLSMIEIKDFTFTGGATLPSAVHRLPDSI